MILVPFFYTASELRFRKKLHSCGVQGQWFMPYINHKISLQFERYFVHFFASSYPFYDTCSYGSTFKRVFFNDDSIQILSGVTRTNKVLHLHLGKISLSNTKWALESNWLLIRYTNSQSCMESGRGRFLLSLNHN